MKLEEAKKKFHGQWIAFRAHGEDANSEGEILLHKKTAGNLIGKCSVTG